jgi:hypothetical protein
VLACPPEVEASVYEQCMAPESRLPLALDEVRIPVKVLRASKQWVRGVFDLSTSPTDPHLAERFPHGRDLLLSGRNHFIPMETPELVVEQIRQMPA